jgi:hypothetical protein
VSEELNGSLEIEDRGSVLMVRVDGGPHALFGRDIADPLDELVERAGRDPNIRAGEHVEFLTRQLAPAARSDCSAARWGCSS